MTIRSVAGIVISLPEPAIADGHPTLPAYWSRFAGSVVLKQGPLHIHAIKDPNPIWDPNTGGWTHPPPPVKPKPGAPKSVPPGVGDYRWSVDTLPDPGGFSNGWYWLGDPTSRDDTAGITAGAQQWAASPGTGGPSWHSFFPFKPSVSAYDAYIPGERSIHHPRGVHCNSHWIEHMWCDLGGSKPQPFTWIVVASIMSERYDGYRHTILDTGRNPDDAGFPRYNPSDCSADRQIADGLYYRTRLTTNDGEVNMSTRTDESPLRIRRAAGHHPGMYVAVFNGAKSTLGLYDPFGQNLSGGKVSDGPIYQHRYMVFGREQGWMSQNHSANLLMFEMRYWRHALTIPDLAAQYAQLSSTYHFDEYKRL